MDRSISYHGNISKRHGMLPWKEHSTKSIEIIIVRVAIYIMPAIVGLLGCYYYGVMTFSNDLIRKNTIFKKMYLGRLSLYIYIFKDTQIVVYY